MSGSSRGDLSVYDKNAAWCAQRDVPNSAISAPKLADCFIYLGLSWLGVQLVFNIDLYQLFEHIEI